MIDDGTRGEAEQAAAAFEEAIERDWQVTHQNIADAVRRLVALRDGLLERSSTDDVRRTSLGPVNALLSLAHGAEHLLIGLHRRRMLRVRDGLKALLQSG